MVKFGVVLLNERLLLLIGGKIDGVRSEKVYRLEEGGEEFVRSEEYSIWRSGLLGVEWLGWGKRECWCVEGIRGRRWLGGVI